MLQGAFPSLDPVLQAASASGLAQVGIAIIHCLPVVFAFVLVPILDYILGEEDAQALQTDSKWTLFLCKIICYGFVLIHLVAVVTAAHTASLAAGNVPMLALICLNSAVSGGYGITVAHELIHGRDKLDRFLGQVLLSTLFYKHWGHSHMAHHAQVCVREHRICLREHRICIYLPCGA
jgi:alkane 1-monooxygenase